MLSNLKIGTKLGGGFLAVAAIALAIGLYAIVALREINDASTLMYDKMTAPLAILTDVTENFGRIRVRVRELVEASDAREIEEHVATLRQVQADMARKLDELQKGIVAEETRRQLEEARKGFVEYGRIVDQVVPLARENRDPEARALLKSGEKVASETREAIGKLAGMKAAAAKKISDDNAEHVSQAIRLTWTVLVLALALAGGIGIGLTMLITRPLNAMAQAARRLASGDVNQRIEHHSGDETGALAESFRETIRYIQEVAEGARAIARGDLTVKLTPRSKEDLLTHSFVEARDALQAMAQETRGLIEAATEGRLSARGNAAKFQGTYAEIVAGVNALLDSVIGPLNVAAEYVERISRGNIPPKITDAYKGDLSELKNNLNQCIDAIDALVQDATLLAAAAQEGKLATRTDASRHEGDFRKIVEGVNKTLDAVIGPLNVAAEYVERISHGDIPPKITDAFNGDFNEIKINLNQCIDAVNALVKDANLLAAAAVEGKLATRADATRHGGDFRKIIDGVNRTLDAVIGPLNVAAEYVERISNGDIPPKITDGYHGDFNEIRNNLNRCIDAVSALVSDASALSRAAMEGKLSTRADAGRHGGDFRKIVEGVNLTLDAVIGPLGVAAKYVERISAGDIPQKITDRYHGDFNELKNNLNTCIESQSALIAQMTAMSRQHDLGDIDAVIPEERFQGAYREMAKGVNAMVAGHLAVNRKAMGCVAQFATGDFDAPLEKFPGKKAFINDNIELLRSNVKRFIDEMGQMSRQHDLGEIDAVIPEESFQAAYREMAKGVNAMVAGHLAVKRKAMGCLAEFGRGNFDAPLEKFPGKKALINETIEQVRKNLQGLIEDTNMLASAAVEGRLDSRADGTRHGGDFRKIVEGVNRTLDNVVTPMRDIGRVLERMAANDLTARVTGEYRGDFNALKSAANLAGDQLRKAMEQITGNTTTLASASEELIKVSQAMSGTAEETSSQANVVSAASEQVNKNVQIVATSTEEMSSSVKEIAKSATEAAKVASLAVRMAETTNETITKLGTSSAEVGQVIKVITSIAQQTNLLALNATIEAARAGEAGKGFAVVANEVKELAKETAKATEDISRKIEAIQGDTRSAVEAIGHIGAVIKQINDLQGTIASAVEQQSATTASIERNVAEAAKATSEIAQNITGVAQAAGATAAGAGDTLSSAQSLARMASDLQSIVGSFKV
jgi:methyl-accepting chemotaxis protein